MKQYLEQCFLQSGTVRYRITNDVLAFVTVVSIIAIALETVVAFERYATWFVVVEWVAVSFFLAEYLGRWYVTRPRRQYVFSFFGIIDLLAIAPTILGLGNFTFLKAARAVRIIRMLRMLRMAKVSRSDNLQQIEESYGVAGLSVALYGSVLLFALLIMSTLLYVVEPAHSSFTSIPLAMWWSLKVFLGGIAVSAPETFWGEALLVAARFTGLLLLGLLIGVVGNVFKVMINGTK